MANTWTAADAAKVAANLVRKDAPLSSLVSNNFQNDLLGGGRGNAAVQIKMPSTLVARTRATNATTAIQMDEITESFQTFNLSKVHDYNAVALTEYDLTLGLTDFSAQVLKPQAEAIAAHLENKVLVALQGVPETEDIAFDPANPIPTFTELRKRLRNNGVSQNGLNVVVGTDVYAALLDAKALDDASQAGDSEALRNANVGRIRNFRIVEDNNVEAGEIIAFHRDAVTLITRAPVVPQGASFGATVQEAGFSMRYIRDYVPDTTQDRSLVSTFSAVGILPTYRVDRTFGATPTAEVVEVPNGGILRLDTTTAPAGG